MWGKGALIIELSDINLIGHNHVLLKLNSPIITVIGHTHVTLLKYTKYQTNFLICVSAADVRKSVLAFETKNILWRMNHLVRIF